MNRADLLYSVLRDGRPHSRREIFERVGYMLTNNAASELRARGVDVVHTREGRLDVYSLGGDAVSMHEGGSAFPQSEVDSHVPLTPPAGPGSTPGLTANASGVPGPAPLIEGQLALEDSVDVA